MAAVTLAVTSDASSLNQESYASSAFTPAADDLLVVFVAASQTVAAGTLTSSVSGKTFSRKDSGVFDTSTDTVYVFVSDQLASAESQTVTFACTGDAATNCLISIFRVSGITQTGLSAILQTAKAENQSNSTPATTFAASVQTGNPTLTFVASTDNTNITEPTGWTLGDRPTIGTPVTEATNAYRNSGFTGTTITWGSSTVGNYAVLSVEVDSSAGGGAFTLDANAGSYAITGTAAALEFDRQIVADSGTYAINGTDATLQFGNTLAADAGSYAINGAAAALEFDRILDASAAVYTINGTDAALDYVRISTAATALTYGAAPHTLPKDAVRRKWEEIEDIDRRIAAKQEAERENIRKQEEAKRQLAELEEKKRQTRTIAERRRKLEARIEAYQAEIAELRSAMVELLDEIERLRTEAELQRTMALRRRRLLLAIATAA